MFFTLKSISCFILDADGFDPPALQQIVGLLSSTAPTIIFTNHQTRDVERIIDLSKVDGIVEQAFVGDFFQRSVRASLGTYSFLPNQTVFISTSIQRIQMALEFFMGTILFQTNFSHEYSAVIYRSCPDYCVASIPDLESVVKGKNIGWCAEQQSRTPTCLKLWTRANQQFCRIAVIPNDEIPDCPNYSGGRYYDTRDPRFSLSALSHRILHSKDYPEHVQGSFAYILVQTAKIAMLSAGVQQCTVACIPARPGEKNRNEIFVNAMPKDGTWSDISSHVSINANLITCIKNYGKLKGLKFFDRRKEVKDAFILSQAQNVAGKNIIVVDDVLTTNASMNEIVRLLKASGAVKVMPVTIAYHPLHEVQQTLPPDPLCTKCNAPMVCKRNKKDGSIFYGCNNFVPGGEKHPTLNFGIAVQKRISALQNQLMEEPNNKESNWWDSL